MVRKIEFVYSTYIDFAANSNLIPFPNFKYIRNNSVSEFADNPEIVRKIESVYSMHIEFAANSNLVIFPNVIIRKI